MKYRIRNNFVQCFKWVLDRFQTFWSEFLNAFYHRYCGFHRLFNQVIQVTFY